MSMWNQILQYHQDLLPVLRTIYRFPFSIQVRHAIASWIEDNIGSNQHLNPDNPNDIPIIDEIMLAMAAEIERQIQPGATPPPTFDSRNISEHMSNCAQNIRRNYGKNRPALFAHIRDCLSFESSRIQQQHCQGETLSFPSTSSTSTSSSTSQIHNNPIAAELQAKFDRFNIVTLRNFETSFNSLQLRQHELNRMIQKNFEQQPGMERMQQGFQEEEYYELAKASDEFLSNAQTCSNEVENLVENMVSEVGRWKSETQCIYEGKYQHTTMPVAQLGYFFNTTSKFIWKMLDSIKTATTSTSNVSQRCNENVMALLNVQQKIVALFQKLVFNSFIIKIQPHQVLRTGAKIHTVAQLLIGDQIKDLPTINISLLSETEAVALLNSTTSVSFACASSSTNESWIEGDAVEMTLTEDNQYCANFSNSKIKAEGFKRMIDKKVKNRYVVDINSYVYYYGQFQVDGITFNLGTFSYPVKVTTNASQDFNSWQTALWDLSNGSLSPGTTIGERAPTPWCNFKMALNVWFKRQTGRGLTNENIDFIVTTLLPMDLAAAIQNDPSTCITFTQFCEDEVPGDGRHFTLWSWLFDIVKLITEHLTTGEKSRPFGLGQSPSGLWGEGYIMGPVTAASTHELLQTYNSTNVVGGFVIRFSPNSLGTITIEWMEEGTIFCTRITRSDLSQRSLENRIRDISKWQILYSNNPPENKSNVLSRYNETEIIIPPPGEFNSMAGGKIPVHYIQNKLEQQLVTKKPK